MFEGSLFLSAPSLSPLIKTATSEDEEYVIIRQNCKISPSLYQDINIQSQFNPKIVFSYQDIGRTSLNIKLNLYKEGSDEVYATNIRKLINVSMKTKKAVLNNPLYLEQAERINSVRSSYKWFVFPTEIPRDVFTMTIRSHYSDTDYLGHVNNCSYIRFCLDCCACAAQANFFVHFKADFCYPVLDVDIQYLGESFANETLEISIWQSTKDICDVYCIIQRRKRVIVKTYLHFGSTRLDQSDCFISKL